MFVHGHVTMIILNIGKSLWLWSIIISTSSISQFFALHKQNFLRGFLLVSMQDFLK